MIYTIGYAHVTVGMLIETMDRHDVRLLCDIRTTPYSRLSQFNRDALRAALRGVLEGGRYHWMGRDCGGKNGPVRAMCLANILKAEKKYGAIMLMCMEADPAQCHRYQDIGLRLLRQGHDIVHLMWEPGLLDSPGQWRSFTTSCLKEVCDGRKKKAK